MSAIAAGNARNCSSICTLVEVTADIYFTDDGDATAIHSGVAIQGSCSTASDPRLCTLHTSRSQLFAISGPRAKVAISSLRIVKPEEGGGRDGAAFGGAVAVFDNGEAHFSDCIFEGNTGGQVGWSANVHAQPPARSCSLGQHRRSPRGSEDKAMPAASPVQGGAIAAYSGAVLALIRCTFVGNRAGSVGGAISLGGATARMEYCTFTRNHAGQGGGALALDGHDEAWVLLSAFTNNTAGYGWGPDVYLRHSTSSKLYFQPHPPGEPCLTRPVQLPDFHA